MNFKHIGRFFVDSCFFDNLKPHEGVNLFRNMVVLDARYDANTHRREYTAIHPHFAPVKQGDMIPEYVATFKEGTSTPTWLPMPPMTWVRRGWSAHDLQSAMIVASRSTVRGSNSIPESQE